MRIPKVPTAHQKRSVAFGIFTNQTNQISAPSILMKNGKTGRIKESLTSKRESTMSTNSKASKDNNKMGGALKVTDTERLVAVEKNLEQAITKMTTIDQSLVALTTKLDAVFGKVMGYPAPLNVRIASGVNNEEGSDDEEDTEVMLEEEVEEHQRLIMSDQDAYDDIEIQSDVFPTVEKNATPMVINDSDNWRINPKNRFRLSWDLVLVMPCLVYLCVAMPFRLCFGNEAPLFTYMYFWEFFIDMVFLVDITLNFFTGFYVGRDETEDIDLIEFDLKRIAWNYMSSWFLLDVVSGIPFALLDLLMSADAGAFKSAKTFKLLRFLRFLKLGRLLKFEKIFSAMDRDTMDTIEDILQNSSTRTVLMLTKLAVILGLVCHFMSCGFVLIGRQSLLVDQPSWLDDTLHGPYTAKDTTGKTGDASVNSIYIAAFYFCMTTMTSVGYGDIIPVSNSERIFAMILEFVGAITFAMIIASLTSIITSMDMNTRKTAEQLDAVASFVEVRQFPEALGRRIRRHFRHFYSLKSAIDETKIFTDLSAVLRKEVSTYLVVELMGRESFFMTIPNNLWSLLLPLLRPMRFEQKEVICAQDEDCFEMHVVISGSAQGSNKRTSDDDTPRIRHILAGGNINVICVLGLWQKCLETVSASTPVETYTVSDVDFTSLFKGSSDSAYEKLQVKESFNFKMDRNFITASSPFGKPLYFSCFSSVEIDLKALRCSKTTKTAGASCWLVIQLVDEAGNAYHEIWRYQTAKVTASLEWNETIRWHDITAPFAKSKVRFRLFEEVNGLEYLIDEMVLSLADLDSDHPHRAHALDYDKVTNGDELRTGEVEGWFSFEGDGDDESLSRRRSTMGVRANQTSAVKNNRWDKMQRTNGSSGDVLPRSPKTSGKQPMIGTKGSSSYSVHLKLYAQRPEKDKARERAMERKQKSDKLEKKRSFTLDRKSSSKSFRKSPRELSPRKLTPLEVQTDGGTYSL